MDLTHLSRHPCESRGPAFLGKIGQLRRRHHFFTASKAGTYFVPHERWREARPKQITTVSLIKCTVTGTQNPRTRVLGITFNMKYFILNESRRPDVLGNLAIYKTLGKLVSDIEAIDVLNDEYYAFTTEGARVELTAKCTNSEVDAVEMLPKPDIHLVYRLIREHLLRLIGNKKLALNQTRIESAQSMEALIQCIPQSLIEQ